MDKLETYRQAAEKVIREYAQYTPSNGKLETIAVCDRDNDNYLMLSVGWYARWDRAHGVIIHLRIRDSKVIVEEDNIGHGIHDDLLAAGVAESDIIYAEAEDISKLAA